MRWGSAANAFPGDNGPGGEDAPVNKKPAAKKPEKPAAKKPAAKKPGKAIAMKRNDKAVAAKKDK